MSSKIIIGIAGGTGSGKTSVANLIVEDLMKSNIDVVLLEQDSYYKSNSHLDFLDRTKLNYDHPDSIDFDLLIKHLIDLKNDKSINKPNYDFTTHLRTSKVETISSKEVIIVEGILLFIIPELRNLFNVKVFVDADDDIRLLRRIERDMQERKRDLQSIKDQYLLTVKPMHNEFVEPSKRYADIIIPRGKENEIAIKMLSSRIKYLLRVKERN